MKCCGERPCPTLAVMWKATAIFKSEEDFSVEDLRQENLTLRNELSVLYGKLLENDESMGRKKMSVAACQTDSHLAFHIPDVHEKVGGLTTELSHQRALNVEQANRAKESERRIRDCESKMLDMNMELLQTVPIKARVVELVQQTEQLQAKISSTANDFINLSVEVNHHKAVAEKLGVEIRTKEADIAALQEHMQLKVDEARRAQQRLDQANAQLEAATNLNSEYQEKLRKDDVLYLQRTGELNQLERKCESQSREISRLVDRMQAIVLHSEEVENQLRQARCKALNGSPQQQRTGAGAEDPFGLGAADCSPGLLDTEDCVCGEFRFFQKAAATAPQPRAGEEPAKK